MPRTGRPPSVGVRHRNSNVYLRFRGDEWSLGRREDWTDAQIEAERARILAENTLGKWTGPPPRSVSTTETRHRRGPRIEDELDDFYKRQEDRNLDENTLVDLAARIRHLKSFFGEAGNDYRMHDLSVPVIEAYQSFKLRETERITELRHRHRVLKDQTLTEDEIAIAAHPTRTGLSPLGINRTVTTLGRVVTRYQAKPGGLQAMPENPAKNPEIKLNVTKKRTRSYLEADQLQALFDAAKLMESEARADRRLLGRFETLAVLCCAGLRIGEMCALERRDVNLEAAKLYVADSKTDTGIREVWLSPWLVDVLHHWMHVRQTKFVAPTDPLFPNTKGKFRDEDRYRDRIMGNAVARGEELLVQRDLSPMPREVTPHSLRRTYVTYAAEVGWPQRFVMNQVGHADSAMTTQVYNQLMRDRDDPRMFEWVGDPVARRAKREASRQQALGRAAGQRPALSLVEPLADGNAVPA